MVTAILRWRRVLALVVGTVGLCGAAFGTTLAADQRPEPESSESSGRQPAIPSVEQKAGPTADPSGARKPDQHPGPESPEPPARKPAIPPAEQKAGSPADPKVGRKPDQRTGAGSPVSTAQKASAPSTEQKFGPPPDAGAARKLPIDILEIVIDAAARVHADLRKVDDLRRQLKDIQKDVDGLQQHAAFINLASDGRRIIVEAFERVATPSGDVAQPKLPAATKVDAWPLELYGFILAIVLGVASLVTSLISFRLVRSATKKALLDAGLL